MTTKSLRRGGRASCCSSSLVLCCRHTLHQSSVQKGRALVCSESSRYRELPGYDRRFNPGLYTLPPDLSGGIAGHLCGPDIAAKLSCKVGIGKRTGSAALDIPSICDSGLTRLFSEVMAFFEMPIQSRYSRLRRSYGLPLNASK